MIINFTVGNYRSFKDKKVLSMEATAIKELNESVKIGRASCRERV